MAFVKRKRKKTREIGNISYGLTKSGKKVGKDAQFDGQKRSNICRMQQKCAPQNDTSWGAPGYQEGKFVSRH